MIDDTARYGQRGFIVILIAAKQLMLELINCAKLDPLLDLAVQLSVEAVDTNNPLPLSLRSLNHAGLTA